MAKIFIYPSTSLILSDMVERFGHEALGAAIPIRERIQTPGLDSPPLQMTFLPVCVEEWRSSGRSSKKPKLQ